MKYLEVDKMRGKISKSEFRGEFTFTLTLTLTFSLTFSLTFTLTFTLTFSLTSTLHLQIDGASSRSTERHFLNCASLPKLEDYHDNHDYLVFQDYQNYKNLKFGPKTSHNASLALKQLENK